MRPFGLMLFAGLLAACGGSLDRRDGALLIELKGVPAGADEFSVTVATEKQTFAATFARRSQDVINDFSAVPIGRATLGIVVRSRGRALTSRQNISVEVLENKTQLVIVELAAGPEISIVEPAETSVRRFSQGNVEIRVLRVDETVPTDLWIRVGTSTIPHTIEGSGWTASIDPKMFVTAPPSSFWIDIEACAAGDRVACTVTRRVVMIERRAWKIDLPVIRARPAISGGTVVVGDRQGGLHVVSLESGEVQRVLALDGPLTRPVLIAADLIVALDGGGVLRALPLAGGAQAWSVELGSEASAPIYDEQKDRILAGAGARLVAIDLSSGELRELHVFENTISRAPLADQYGAVAADDRGKVIFFDSGDRVESEAQLDSAPAVPPIRQGADTIFFDDRGAMYRFPSPGKTALVLAPAPYHAPVLAGDTIAVAFGDRVAFIRGEEATIIEAGGPITGAPLTWPEGQAVLIGLSRPPVVKLISEDRRQRVVSSTGGAPLPGLLRESPRQVLVPQNTGALEMFELEESFF
jgi:hypothetical protein